MMPPLAMCLRATLLLLCLPSLVQAQAGAYIVGQRDTDPGPANRGIQILTVIDTATGAKLGSVPLGTSCFCVNANGAVVSPDGSRLYVTNFHDATITVVDTETTRVAGTLNTHPSPTALAITPDGNRLYVNTFLSPGPGYVVQVIDIASGGTITTIPLAVAQSGSGMVIAPDGSRVYVSNTALNNSSVKVIDTASNTVVSTIHVGITPRGLDVSPDGAFVFAAVQNSNALGVIQTATATALASLPVGQLPLSVAVTPDGTRAYVTNSSSNSISSSTTARERWSELSRVSRRLRASTSPRTAHVASWRQMHGWSSSIRRPTPSRRRFRSCPPRRAILGSW